MLKSNERKNKLLTLFITTTIIASAITIAMPTIQASAAPAKIVVAGNGQGSIFYSAHRIPSSHWAPCFAETCDQGTGPGTWVWFVLFDDAGQVVPLSDQLANEDGVLITGLEVGRTYFLQPTDCEDPNCGPPPHNVRFNNWEDCSINQQRAFVITSASTLSGRAYYRYHLIGEPDTRAPCYTAGQANNSPPSSSSPPPSSSPPSNNSPSTPPQGTSGSPSGTTGTAQTGATSIWDNFGMRIQLDAMIQRAESVKLGMLQTADDGTVSFTGNTTQIASLPDAAQYDSLYDLLNEGQSPRLTLALTAIDFVGIDLNSLSEEDQLELLLMLVHGPLSETIIASDTIPETDLSGVPLGPLKLVTEYSDFSDVITSDPRGVGIAMAELEVMGVDINSLSDKQKSYIVLTHMFGEPEE